LEERPFLPLQRYLEPADILTSRADGGPRPSAPMKEGTAVFFELARPLEPIPPELETTSPITSTTAVRYFSYHGKPLATGTMTRQVQIEGFEDVECPAGRFEHCLRVRVDLTVRFPWRVIVDLTSYLWLSPKVGEVRRVQHISGWFLIFWFGNVHEYQLVSFTPAHAGPGSAGLPPPQWAYGAILFERAAPHPQIAGMIVDLAGSAPGR